MFYPRGRALNSPARQPRNALIISNLRDFLDGFIILIRLMVNGAKIPQKPVVSATNTKGNTKGSFHQFG
jgi:hypothetical protein